jgi:hypothetical protein
MSISAHLTPEPERRLWIIHESMRRAIELHDGKIATLTGFAAAELAFMALRPPAGALAFLTRAALAAALPLGVFAFSPLARLPGFLSFLDEPKHATSVNDCLIAIDDVAKHTQAELVLRLDKYLGGGVTATPYYEDIVGQAIASALIASRKARLFRVSCAVVGFAQLCLFAQILGR